jgi:hypothetical protein
MEAGRRNEGREPLQELDGLEDDVRGPIAPAVLEAVEEASVHHSREPLGRHRRPGDVAAQPLEPKAVTRERATFACRLTPPTVVQRSPSTSGRSSASMRSPSLATRCPARGPIAARPASEAA